MKHELRILDGSGDTTLTWERGALSEAEVERKFNEMIASNRFFAYTTTGEESRQLRKFDASETQIIITPRVVGG